MSTTTQPLTAQNDQAADDVLRKNLLVQQATKIVSLQEEIQQRQEEVDAIKTQILDSYPVGKYEAGSLTVDVRAGAKTINAKKFEDLFPPEQHPDLYKLSPDTTKARKQLGEDALAPTFTSRKPTVVIA